MEHSEFDKFADQYAEMHARNIGITGEAPEYFAEYKIRDLRRFVEAEGTLPPARILDFGSGIGGSIPFFRTYFPNARLLCSDVSRRSLDIARTRFPDFGQDVVIEGPSLPLPDGDVDLAFSACVFHHIEHEQHVPWLQELRRVVRPGGTFVVFEHNPLNPLTVRAVNSCEFDENARLIRASVLAARCRAAGWSKTRIRFHLFFPRALAALRPGERLLEWVPLGGQYSVECR